MNPIPLCTRDIESKHHQVSLEYRSRPLRTELKTDFFKNPQSQTVRTFILLVRRTADSESVAPMYGSLEDIGGIF